jgi:8-oxo-dGTP diphosphatase
MVVDLTVSFAAGIYAAVSLGVNVDELMEQFGVEFGSIGLASGQAGTLALALVLNKATSPFRIPITIALTPVIAKKIRAKGKQSQQQTEQKAVSTTMDDMTQPELPSQGTDLCEVPGDDVLKDRKPIDVVVGVVWRNLHSCDKDNEFLIQQVQSHRAFAGMWELPGGKVEEGEDLEQALSRELKEELDITVTESQFWKQHTHYYANNNLYVRLHFFHVTGYEGSPVGIEGQILQWHGQNEQDHSVNFLEADKDILEELRTLQLPSKQQS